ncbi:MAG: hypothetical protein GY808_14300 [Gammaproteobacteria bacterium]|nr:hypothetical protein [Gammaproteobacteria bacterium]
MCWSGEASAVVAVVGLASTVYFYKKGESRALCAALFYFSLMELIQAYTYTVIDQCYNPRNTVATWLGYIHISFQPIFINMVSMHFLPKAVRVKIAKPVYFLSFLAAIIFMARMLPINWEALCYQWKYHLPFLSDIKYSMPFCGEKMCSVSGDWHIAWEAPAAANLWMANTYAIAAFFLPIFYGAWRMTIYHLITGPLLAILTTNNANEYAAVWCLYSIGLLLLLIKTPIRKLIHVKTFYGFNFPKFMVR